jgi:hypothetical protein
MNLSLREAELAPAPLPSPPPTFLVRVLLALRRTILRTRRGGGGSCVGNPGPRAWACISAAAAVQSNPTC